jgi:response regulator RpfG family c-di-GMP phosphodiesterase
MAHGLKLDVIAEGVETAAQLAFLRRHRCDQMQGYYFSRPLAVDKLEQLLWDDARLPALDETNSPLDTVLLLDDEPEVLAALRALLEPDGYRVLSAATAAEGFELMALHQVQVIICDPREEMTSGTGFLDRVKDLYPDALRIVLSACSETESVIAAINRGAVHRYYTKPWDSAGLRSDVHDAFRHYWMLHDLREERRELELAAVRPHVTPAQAAPASVERESSRSTP